MSPIVCVYVSVCKFTKKKANRKGFHLFLVHFVDIMKRKKLQELSALPDEAGMFAARRHR